MPRQRSGEERNMADELVRALTAFTAGLAGQRQQQEQRETEHRRQQEQRDAEYRQQQITMTNAMAAVLDYQ